MISLRFVVTLILLAGPSLGHAVVPGVNGRIIYNASLSGDGAIFKVDPDGANEGSFVPHQGTFPAVSPDGRKVAFEGLVGDFGDLEIFIYDSITNRTVQITDTDGKNVQPAWSPDGNAIVFGHVGGGSFPQSDLYSMAPVQGADWTQITHDAAVDFAADWSPDGLTIVYNRGNGVIAKVAADGTGQPVNLTDATFLNFNPAWSPDGNKVAFESTGREQGTGTEVYVMDPSGSSVTRLTRGGIDNMEPTWSPDGTKIAFTRVDGGQHIYVMPANGDGAQGDLAVELTEKGSNDGDAGQPTWSIAVGPVPTATGPTPTPTPTSSLATPSSTPSPTPTSQGPPALPADAGKTAAKCQKELDKATAKFLGAKLKSFDKCGQALVKCADTADAAKRDKCRAKGLATCTKEIAKIAAAEAALGGVVVAKCGPVGLADLLAAAGLGFLHLQTECATTFQSPLSDVAAIGTCLTRHHECRGEEAALVRLPRVRALMEDVGVTAAALQPLGCLANLGGDASGVAAELVKPFEQCLKAVAKVGGKLVTTTVQALTKCHDAAFACVQTKGAAAACRDKAAATCTSEAAKLVAARAALPTAVTAKCGSIDFAALAAADALGLTALAPTCDALGVPALTSLDAWSTCLVRGATCAAERSVAFAAPRAGELFDFAGQTFGRDFCGN